MRFKSTFLTGILLALTFLVLTSMSSVNDQNKGAEIIVVEIIFSFNGPKDVSGIYISRPDGKTEKIPLIGFVGEENIQKNGITIARELQKIYADGWNLESSCGGDNSKRYIFKK
jgi:hypothetical protein